MWTEAYKKYKSFRSTYFMSTQWTKWPPCQVLKIESGKAYISFTRRDFTFEEFCQEMQNSQEMFEQFADLNLKRQLKIDAIIDDD